MTADDAQTQRTPLSPDAPTVARPPDAPAVGFPVLDPLPDVARGGPDAVFRLVFAGAGTTTGAAELCGQLRRRLLFISLLASAGCLLSVVRLLVLHGEYYFTKPWHRDEPHTDLAEFVVLLTLVLLPTWYLWKHRKPALPRLRVLEVFLFSTFAAYFIHCEAQAIVRLSGTPPERWTLLAEALVLPFAVLLVGYGILIPNTWRRCAAGVALIAAGAYAGALAGFALEGHSVGVILEHLVAVTIWLGMAGGIVVYGAYRIEVLQASTAAARQLGQYRLTDVLGEGGMGDVYLAEHAMLRRPCAVKLIKPSRAADPSARARFEREAQATASLSHPHIVRIYDYGCADDGTYYYVMAYLTGITLAKLVEEEGALSEGRAVAILRQLCSALSAAHAAGLTHRDVKPRNVIVQTHGRQTDFATLLDFGLVRHRTTGSETKSQEITAEGTIMGTLAYMAPEQAAGEAVDRRADIYAVGAVGYCLLSGRPPFEAASPALLLAAVLRDAPKPLVGLSPELAGVILRCLAKSPAERFATADELDAALEMCANRRRPAAGPPTGAVERPAAT